MSRLGERSLFVLILLCVAVFGVSAGAGAAGFVVTKTMWNSMTTKVNARATKTTLNTKIASLQQQINEANGQIAALQAANPGTGDDNSAAALDEHVNDLIAANKAVKQASEDAGLAIARLDSVETSITGLKTFNKNLHVRFSDNVENGLAGPHVYFEDVNVHVLDTSYPWPKGGGQGNLIIGGNGAKPVYTRPTTLAAGNALPSLDWNVSAIPTPRTGSNTLVIGEGHAWEGWGGIVTGYGNTLLGDVSEHAALGGQFNSAAGSNTIVGGAWNSTLGKSNYWQLIVGGVGNTIGTFAPNGQAVDSASDEVGSNHYRSVGVSGSNR